MLFFLLMALTVVVGVGWGLIMGAIAKLTLMLGLSWSEATSYIREYRLGVLILSAIWVPWVGFTPIAGMEFWLLLGAFWVPFIIWFYSGVTRT
jgi:hypothetical protein